MKTRTGRVLSATAITAVLLIWFAMILLVLYVPRLVALWSQTEAELSPARMALVQLASLAQANWPGIILLLLIATAAGVAWRIRVVQRASEHSATPRDVSYGSMK